MIQLLVSLKRELQQFIAEYLNSLFFDSIPQEPTTLDTQDYTGCIIP